jgi:hypothetical protein
MYAIGTEFFVRIIHAKEDLKEEASCNRRLMSMGATKTLMLGERRRNDRVDLTYER